MRDNSLNTIDVHSFIGNDVIGNTLTGADLNESTLELGADPWTVVPSDGFFEQD